MSKVRFGMIWLGEVRSDAMRHGEVGCGLVRYGTIRKEKETL